MHASIHIVLKQHIKKLYTIFWGKIIILMSLPYESTLHTLRKCILLSNKLYSLKIILMFIVFPLWDKTEAAR